MRGWSLSAILAFFILYPAYAAKSVPLFEIQVRSPELNFRMLRYNDKLTFESPTYKKTLPISNCNSMAVDLFQGDYISTRTKEPIFLKTKKANSVLLFEKSAKKTHRRFVPVLSPLGQYLHKLQGKFLVLLIQSQMLCEPK